MGDSHINRSARRAQGTTSSKRSSSLRRHAPLPQPATPVVVEAVATSASRQRVLIPTKEALGLIHGQFLAEAELGRGAFGTVFSARSLDDPTLVVAVKVESHAAPTPQLVNEYESMLIVADFEERAAASAGRSHIPLSQRPLCVPRPLACEHDREWTIMVMEHKGVNLHEYFKQQGRFFSPARLAWAGVQMLRRLRELHACSLVHRDVKPHNFCLENLGGGKERLVLIDLGLAKLRFTPCELENHQRMTRSILGTPMYVSTHTHQHREIDFRDDLVSMAYVMFFLWRGGNLPWFACDVKHEAAIRGVTDRGLLKDAQRNLYQSILMCKIKSNNSDLLVHPRTCQAAPAGLVAFWKKVQLLPTGRKGVIDYDLLEGLLASIDTTSNHASVMQVSSPETTTHSTAGYSGVSRYVGAVRPRPDTKDDIVMLVPGGACSMFAWKNGRSCFKKRKRVSVECSSSSDEDDEASNDSTQKCWVVVSADQLAADSKHHLVEDNSIGCLMQDSRGCDASCSALDERLQEPFFERVLRA